MNKNLPAPFYHLENQHGCSLLTFTIVFVDLQAVLNLGEQGLKSLFLRSQVYQYGVQDHYLPAGPLSDV